MIRRRSHFIDKTALGLVLILVCCTQLWERARCQVKEPPIPVIIGKEQPGIHASGAQTIILTVADFNYLIAREDSLQKAVATQNQLLQQESRSRSFLVYALVIGLVLSNIASVRIASKRRDAARK